MEEYQEYSVKIKGNLASTDKIMDKIEETNTSLTSDYLGRAYL